MAEEQKDVVVEDQPKAEETKVEETRDDSVEDLKKKAESIEAEVKELKSNQKESEVKNNYQRRIEKAEAKKAELAGEPAKAEEPQEFAFDAYEVLALDKAGIEKGSDQEKVVQKYIESGLVANATEALGHAGVKAELEVLDTQNKVRATIDENDSDEARQESKREIVDNYRAHGDVPDDPKAREVIAEDNLKNMGF